MLKLLKYEWKACARTCLPLYLAVLVMSIINRLFSLGNRTQISNATLYQMTQVLAGLAFVGMIVAVFVVTAVLLIQRFYKSLLGDEGYLMFTLPVTPAQHIMSKMLIACVMSVLSILVACLGIGIMAAGMSTLTGLGRLIAEIFHSFTRDPNTLFYTLEMLLFCVLLSVCGILFVYLCIALGHLAKKHRIAMAIVWYFVLSFAVQFLFMALLIGVGNWTPLDPVFRAVMDILNGMQIETAIHIGMVLLCAGMLVPCAVLFFGTQYILKNRLNLE